METKRNLSGTEKFGYSLGAVAKDMVYMLSASYVLYYFQDIAFIWFKTRYKLNDEKVEELAVEVAKLHGEEVKEEPLA